MPSIRQQQEPHYEIHTLAIPNLYEVNGESLKNPKELSLACWLAYYIDRVQNYLYTCKFIHLKVFDLGECPINILFYLILTWEI